MPISENDTVVHDYPIPKRGINLYKSLVDLHPEEAISTQNMTYRNGLSKRDGATLLDTDQVVNSKKILGLHRGYYGNSTRKTLAACDTLISSLESGTWTSSGYTQTTGLKTYFADWAAKGKTYITNGTDAPKTYDGTTWGTMAAATNLPSNIQTLLPYQDRLLCLSNSSSPYIGALSWTASYDDTVFVTTASTNVWPDTYVYGMTHHSATNTDTGYETKILIAGATGMYIFWGTNLTPGVSSDYQLARLPISVGCNAPNTMKWTPKGTIWLGTDRQVYLLPFNSLAPIPIGRKIRSNNPFQNGIESIPETAIGDACAVYHDGYYKLSVASSGQNTNNLHFWLDIDMMMLDEEETVGPWYGPMIGAYDATNTLYSYSISCYAQYNGPGDKGELIAGEDNPYGYVYTLAPGTFGDVNPTDQSTTSIACNWWTMYNDFGSNSLMKDIHNIEIELSNQTSTVSVDFYDITGRIKTGDILTTVPTYTWNSAVNWDSSINWSGVAPVRSVIDIDPVVHTRRCAILMKAGSSDADYGIYALRVAVKENNLIFSR